jgi:uncharacterized membrane protein YhdT
MNAWHRLRNGDVASGLALAALGAYIVQQALRWDYMTPDGPGAGFFPRWYGIAIVALSLLVVARGIRAGALPAAASDQSGARVLVCWIAIVACVLLSKPLGFLASFALLCWFVATVLFHQRQRIALPLALGAALGFWLVFDAGLGVSLPRGPWGI